MLCSALRVFLFLFLFPVPVTVPLATPVRRAPLLLFYTALLYTRLDTRQYNSTRSLLFCCVPLRSVQSRLRFAFRAHRRPLAMRGAVAVHLHPPQLTCIFYSTLDSLLTCSHRPSPYTRLLLRLRLAAADGRAAPRLIDVEPLIRRGASLVARRHWPAPPLRPIAVTRATRQSPA